MWCTSSLTDPALSGDVPKMQCAFAQLCRLGAGPGACPLPFDCAQVWLVPASNIRVFGPFPNPATRLRQRSRSRMSHLPEPGDLRGTGRFRMLPQGELHRASPDGPSGDAEVSGPQSTHRKYRPISEITSLLNAASSYPIGCGLDVMCHLRSNYGSNWYRRSSEILHRLEPRRYAGSIPLWRMTGAAAGDLR
jgi:hypothetical protein